MPSFSAAWRGRQQGGRGHRSESFLTRTFRSETGNGCIQLEFNGKQARDSSHSTAVYPDDSLPVAILRQSGVDRLEAVRYSASKHYRLEEM